jgi:hypothetical protein
MLGVLVSLVVRADSSIGERCPGTALERGPQLISNLNSLKQTVRELGYSGRLTFRLTVAETGSVRDAVVTHPAALKDSSRIHRAISSLKFCPAVRYSRFAAVTVNFDINVLISEPMP